MGGGRGQSFPVQANENVWCQQLRNANKVRGNPTSMNSILSIRTRGTMNILSFSARNSISEGVKLLRYALGRAIFLVGYIWENVAKEPNFLGPRFHSLATSCTDQADMLLPWMEVWPFSPFCHSFTSFKTNTWIT